jgi:hypothetical protein
MRIHLNTSGVLSSANKIVQVTTTFALFSYTYIIAEVSSDINEDACCPIQSLSI